jgi:hypothetical protein
VAHITIYTSLTLEQKVRRECDVWAQLKHENIVPLYGYAENVEVYGPFGPYGALISPVRSECLVRFILIRPCQWYQNGDTEQFIKENGHLLTMEQRRHLVSAPSPHIDPVS